MTTILLSPPPADPAPKSDAAARALTRARERIRRRRLRRSADTITLADLGGALDILNDKYDAEL